MKEEQFIIINMLGVVNFSEVSKLKVVSLAEMKTGQSGRVRKIYGGRGMVARLQALGLHPGKKVTKLSAFFQRGPVVVEIDRSQIALGHGRANRILVEVEE